MIVSHSTMKIGTLNRRQPDIDTTRSPFILDLNLANQVTLPLNMKSR